MDTVWNPHLQDAQLASLASIQQVTSQLHFATPSDIMSDAVAETQNLKGCFIFQAAMARGAPNLQIAKASDVK